MSNKILSLYVALTFLLMNSSGYAETSCHAPVNLKQYLTPYSQDGKPKKELEFLITGCARSGTLFITKVLRLHGLGVRHEWDADFGIVSWVMAVDCNKSPWGPPSNKYYFKHVFHQVRDPLKTIASMMTEGTKSWDFIYRSIPQIAMKEPLLVRCAKYWYYWNLQAESKAEFTFRIEEAATALPEIGKRIGVTLDPSFLGQVSKKINSRHNKHLDRNLTWLDLRRTLTDSFYSKIICLAKRYGYDVTEAERLLHKKKKKKKD